MADGYWRYPDPRQQAVDVPPPASLKRPLPDYGGAPDGYYPREEDRTVHLVGRDTESINASYRYLHNGLSSYVGAEPGRSVVGGMSDRSIEGPHIPGPGGMGDRAIGYNTGPGGMDDRAIGYNIGPGGMGDQAIGYNTGSGGMGDRAIGYNTGPGGMGDRAIGYNTGPGGMGDRAIGYNTGPGGMGDRSIGYNTGPGGMDDRTIGYNTGRIEIPIPPDASNTLFVEGFPASCTRREVSHIFRPFVGFQEARLVKKESKHPGGDPLVMCFVDFGTPNQAAVALDALKGYKFDEHDQESVYLRLQFARFPAPRSFGGPRSRR